MEVGICILSFPFCLLSFLTPLPLSSIPPLPCPPSLLTSSFLPPSSPPLSSLPPHLLFPPSLLTSSFLPPSLPPLSSLPPHLLFPPSLLTSSFLPPSSPPLSSLPPPPLLPCPPFLPPHLSLLTPSLPPSSVDCCHKQEAEECVDGGGQEETDYQRPSSSYLNETSSYSTYEYPC